MAHWVHEKKNTFETDFGQEIHMCTILLDKEQDPGARGRAASEVGLALRIPKFQKEAFCGK